MLCLTTSTPCCLVVPDGEYGVLDGLVGEGVDGRHEEVDGGDELLAALHQPPLRVRVVQELLLQLGGAVRQVHERLVQPALKRQDFNVVMFQL